NFTITVVIDTIRQHHTPGTNPSFFPHLQHQSVHHKKGKTAVTKVASVPSGHNGVQPLAQFGNSGFGKLHTAEFICNLSVFSCGNPIDHHLHQSQHQGL